MFASLFSVVLLSATFVAASSSGASASTPYAGADTLNAISCPNAQFCMSVGTGPTGIAFVRDPYPLGYVATADPGPGDIQFIALNGVSCTSRAFCVAVGYEWHESSMSAVIEQWDGTAWTIVPAGDGSSRRYSAVSCTSPSFCVAVGSQNVAGGSPSSLTVVSTWDGSSWSAATSPNATSGSGSQNALAGVSCTSPTFCVATGASQTAGTPGHQALAEHWDGSTWSIKPSVSVVNNDVGLGSVSCVSPSACLAVGSDTGAVVSSQALAESWDGTAWSRTPTPPGAYDAALLSIDCVRADWCLAVGMTESNTGVDLPVRTIADIWNGPAWSARSPLNGPAPEQSQLSGVSCAHDAQCVAVGLSGAQYRRYGTGHPFAQAFDGAFFTIESTNAVQLVPSVPTDVVVRPGNGRFDVTWKAPQSNGGSAITRYVVRPIAVNFAQPAQAFSPTTRAASVSGLVYGQRYYIAVGAVNENGEGELFSSRLLVFGAPSNPTTVHAVRTAPGTLKVVFAPGAANGAHQVFTAACRSSAWDVVESAPRASSPLTVKGLVPGRSYFCRVTAHNSRGASVPSPATAHIKG